jgi:hypothetical protein
MIRFYCLPGEKTRVGIDAKRVMDYIHHRTLLRCGTASQRVAPGRARLWSSLGGEES